jgi:uncharacterized protein (DUF2384 family)
MASLPHLKVADAPVKDEGDSNPASLRELLNYRKLVARTVDAFGDEVKASMWLSMPNPFLDGETPLRAAQRDGYNFLILEPILTRMEHGINL